MEDKNKNVFSSALFYSIYIDKLELCLGIMLSHQETCSKGAIDNRGIVHR